MSQRLAAVLAADVVGYTRLMDTDAARTLETLRRLRTELFRPMVAGHRGRVVKSMGDGWIVTFDSAAEAVTCAMRLQDQMVLEDAISVRIGIHLGDVTEEDEDVFGDGVNVAARLEALSEPGGVTISDAVHATLDGTLRPAFDDAGAQELKNIDRPVRVWTRGGITGAAAIKDRQGMEGFPRLAIRPVTTNSASDEVRDLADALTHDLATYLGASRWLRTATTAVERPGDFVLLPRLRVSGSRLRLESRLTAPDGTPIWSGKTDGTLDDIFDWQDATASEIATQVLGKILARVRTETDAKPVDALSWEELAILAFAVGGGCDREGMAKGLDYISRAIAQNPPSSFPYESALAIWTSAQSIGYAEVCAPYADDTDRWMRRALELGGATSSSRAMRAFFEYYTTGDALRARSEVDGFLRDIPFDPLALVLAGFLFNWLGDPASGLTCFERFDLFAGQHSLAIPAKNGQGAALVALWREDKALEAFEAAIRMSPGYPAPHMRKAAALANLGRLDEARDSLAIYERLLPGATIAKILRTNTGRAENRDERLAAGLRKLDIPEA